MSTLIEDMHAALKTLAPLGGVWYGVNTTEPPVPPYIVFQRVVSTPNVSLLGQSALQNTRFQIDIYSRRISEAAAMEVALEAMMGSAAFTNVAITSQDFFESDAKIYRVSKDYSVWATN